MTPDNAIFYQLAYTAAAIIYVGYAISLSMRRRRLRERAAALKAGAGNL
jgi:hypothetical protein